jgi:hypothetical protein
VNYIGPRAFIGREQTKAGDLFGRAPWLLWRCIRLPLFLLLAILEPLVRFVLGSLALLGVLMALFWKLAGPPHFPFLLMLGISLGFGLLLAGYQALLRLLSIQGRNRRQSI